MKTMIEKHTQKYPAMTEQDKIKLIYQSEFGCGHFIKDSKVSLELIKKEFLTSSKTDVLFEDIGNGYVRMYLSALKENDFDADLINKIFILSAEDNTGSLNSFKEKLSFIDDSEYKTAYIENGCPMVSHSDTYRKMYKPAYRVIKKIYADVYFLCLEIKRISKNKDIVISIDGRAAAGKTTAAKALGLIFNANIIHADDFFLPFEMRTAERLNEPGGNIHYERLKWEVADNLKNNTFSYGKFDCSIGSVTEKITVKKAPVTIIEGAYSAHPYFGDIYDIKVFFDIDDALQKERILKRNGQEMLNRFTETWIPMENRYIQAFSIKEKSDIIINT